MSARSVLMVGHIVTVATVLTMATDNDVISSVELRRDRQLIVARFHLSLTIS